MAFELLTMEILTALEAVRIPLFRMSASTYAYAIRQLKYADTDKNLARALVSCAARCLARQS